MLLSGCEDPSNVGLGLIPEEGSDPHQITLPAENVEETLYSPITGNRARFAAGAVDDPLFGAVEATGYLDLTAPSSFPEGFSDDSNEITEVFLVLRQTYLYGQTDQTYTLEVRDMPESWPASNVRADTTLTAAADAITSVEITPTDTLIEIPLPDTWIEDHSTQLRGEDDDFTSNFHGFQLSTSNGRAVQGYNADTSRLEVTVGEETATFSISKNLTTITRTSPPTSIDNRLVVQSGSGPAVSLSFPLSADSLRTKALSRFRVLLPIDTETMEQHRPTNFVRPLPEQIVFYGVDADGNRMVLQTGQLGEEENRYVVDHPTLTNEMQRVILGESSYEHYLVTGGVTTGVNVSAALFYDSTAETNVPQATLTVVPLN